MSEALRVALIDSDEDVRAGRRMIIESDKKLSVVFDSFGNLDDIEQLTQSLVDVIVIDQRIMIGSGVDFYQRYRESLGSLDDLAFGVLTTSFEDVALRLAAYQAGFAAAVSLEQGSADLVAAILQPAKSVSSLLELFELIARVEPEPELDLDLQANLKTLKKSNKALFERLSSDWAKQTRSEVDIFVDYLGPLCHVLGAKTSNEIIIRIYRNGYLNG